ncbi:MAG: metallophosphoesterase [Balneolaceae bacterium]|nr:metallophosphoesterase [Balneolaceae bacterium]
MKKPHLLLIAILVMFFASCGGSRLYVSEWSSTQPAAPPEEDPRYSVFLVGDAGALQSRKQNPVFRLLQEKTAEAGEQSAVVFLGDNIYPAGLPKEGEKGRKEAEKKLVQQLESVKDHPGRVFFIPGNHDWNNSNRDGLDAVRRQETFVEAYLGRGNTFLPDGGFPGPVDIELVDDDDTPFDKDIRLVILDTEWWLYEHEKSFGDTGEYELQDAGDFLVELRNIMRERQNDHVIVAAHHPLFSNGTHGGYFPVRNHLLPPVFGTFYVLYRKFIGYRQDIPHFHYRELKNEMMESFHEVNNLVYASGHDHSLQYFRVDRRRYYQHFLVSGAGSRPDWVASGRNAEFTYQGGGFMVVRYYNDGSSWLEAWAPDNTSPEGRLLYRIRLTAPDEDPFYREEEVENRQVPDGLADSTVSIAANPEYDEPGPVFRAVMGSHNRELWSIPVDVPVFDIETVAGGLRATKLGGKGQSNTLRLEDSSGKEYVLRTVDKVAGKIWDEQLRNTLAEDLAQDQFAILNPFGAFMIPPLAEAAGIYHTNPRLYYIPHDPRLGEFARQAGGRLALFEERPDDDMSHAPHFGNASEVISTRAMLTEVDGDLDHRVDQQMMLRNSLFDTWISDWDRHEDQWRWAAFEPWELDSTLTGDARTEGKIYRPIPRDRDTAFMRMNGLVPSLGKLSVFRLYQDFTEDYGNLKGLTAKSLPLTRRFTNELSREQWIITARELTESLTDEVIQDAIDRLPPEVKRQAGDRIAHIMKVRRDKLQEVAGAYFRLLNSVVDVVGSHKKEYVEIEKLDAERTLVCVFKRSDKSRPYFQRVFLSSETEEIRIFGLGDDDLFVIGRNSSNSTLVRIVGGSGEDTFSGTSSSGSSLENIILYDTNTGYRWKGAEELDLVTSDRTSRNRYDFRHGYQYNTTDPLLFFGHNKDDGVFIGGGAAFRKHGFQKSPYAALHTIRGNVAARTGAFNLRYEGRFVASAGNWDSELELHVLTPNNIRNFYGLGNETRVVEEDDDFYRARLWQTRVSPRLRRDLKTGMHFAAGPFFQVTNVREDAGRFVTDPQAGISPNTFEDQWFGGFATRLQLRSVDNSQNPKQGFRMSTRGDLNLGIRNTSEDHVTLASALSLYLSPSIDPQITLATRIGAGHIIGPFPFYKANTLGGVENLRGLRSTRYNGRTSFYNNIEMRGKLFDFNSYLLGGEAGLLGFVDHGRVWTDGEDSDDWHIGYGGGAWVNLFDLTIVRTSIGFAENQWNLLVGAGFFF